MCVCLIAYHAIFHICKKKLEQNFKCYVYPPHLTTATELTNLQVLFVDRATHLQKLKFISITGALITFAFICIMFGLILKQKECGIEVEILKKYQLLDLNPIHLLKNFEFEKVCGHSFVKLYVGQLSGFALTNHEVLLHNYY